MPKTDFYGGECAFPAKHTKPRIFTVRAEERFMARPNDKKFSMGYRLVEMALRLFLFFKRGI